MTTIGQNSANISASELAKIKKAEQNGDNTEQKQTLPSSGTDSFSSIDLNGISREAQKSAADKLTEAGLDPTKVFNGANGDKVAKALRNPKHEVVKIGDSRGVSSSDIKSAPSIENFLSQAGETGLNNEELQKLLEVKLSGSKESREMDLVMTIMTFCTSNPVGVISSLKNLLGSLTSPAAKQLAGSSIGQVTNFAADQAINAAKYKGSADAAKDLLAALKGAMSTAINSCNCSHDGCSQGELDTHSENLTNIASTPTSHTEEFVIIDKETGEIATDENGEQLFFSTTFEDTDHCEENAFVNDTNERIILDSETSAESSLVKAEKEADKHNEQTQSTLDHRVQLSQVKFALNNTTNQNERAKLTSLEKSLTNQLGNA